MSNFIKSTDYALQNEGGFTNLIQDSGGPTNWGITQKTLEAYRKTNVTLEDIKNLTRDQALEVYKALYWTPLGLDAIIDDDVATAIFDIAINRGVEQSLKYAQGAAKVAVDGVMGPVTQTAINAVTKNNFLVRFATLVQAGYVELVVQAPHRNVFIGGWSARAMRLLTLMEGVVL